LCRLLLCCFLRRVHARVCVCLKYDQTERLLALLTPLPFPSLPSLFPPDAAHSVIPPTGEGFNSGAEDVEVLIDAMHADIGHPFSKYNDRRLPDLHALHELAFDANKSNFGHFGPEKYSRLMTTIMVGLAKSCGVFSRTWEDLSFGVDASPPKTYQEIVGVWRWQRLILLPLARMIVWPVFVLVWMMLGPWQLVWKVMSGPFRGARGGGSGGQKPKQG